MSAEVTTSQAVESADRRPPAPTWLFALRRDPWRIEFVDGGPSRGEVKPPAAEARGVTAVFDGVLYNQKELERELGTRASSSEAEVALAAYVRWGDDAVVRLKGVFALVICDGPRRSLVCARDPLGIYPLYWAKAADDVFLSTSVERLVAEQGVSGEINRPAVADRLRHNFPDIEETYFEAVKRVPRGHRMRVTPSGRSLERYWHPVPEGLPIRWIGDDEIGRFDGLFEQAVERSLTLGRTGILLSGGLDSVSIAAVATDLSRERGSAPPLALSVVFPHPESYEEPVQRGVASQLGLDQVLRDFDDAVGPEGLLAASLALARRAPQPLLNFWLPAYRSVILEGKRRGCEVILTGSGGDEWLTVSPAYGADLIRALDVAGLIRLAGSYRRSFTLSTPALWRTLVWSYGIRALLGSAVGSAAPSVMRRRRLRRVARRTPAWISHDPAFRRQLDERAEQVRDPSDADGIYMRELRRGLDHPIVSIELEERFENARDLGVRELHPLLDADLVDFLWRVRPELLDWEGRSKGLVRKTLARRFPDLGFGHHRKMNAEAFFRERTFVHAEGARRQLGGIPALTGLGIIDGAAWETAYRRILARDHHEAFRLWQVFGLEAWLQERV